MAAEENKAVVRRELEEIFNRTGNLDVADEIYARDYIGHQPAPDDIQGVEGAKQFAAIFRRALAHEKAAEIIAEYGTSERAEYIRKQRTVPNGLAGKNSEFAQSELIAGLAELVGELLAEREAAAQKKSKK